MTAESSSFKDDSGNPRAQPRRRPEEVLANLGVTQREEKGTGSSVNSLPKGRRQKREMRLGMRLRSLEMRLRESQRVLRELFTMYCALVEHLEDDGLAVASDLGRRAKDLVKSHGLDPRRQVGLGILLSRGRTAIQDGTQKVNCEDRRSVCQGRCCTLSFALRADEVRAGRVQWDPEKPFSIGKDREGVYCVHCDPESRRCLIYDHRPLVCRRYSCQKDKRMWQDFEAAVPGPYLRRVFPQRQSPR